MMKRERRNTVSIHAQALPRAPPASCPRRDRRAGGSLPFSGTTAETQFRPVPSCFRLDMDDAEAPPAAGRVKRLASNNVAAVIAAAGPARREVRRCPTAQCIASLPRLAEPLRAPLLTRAARAQSPVASTPPADGAVVAQASPELPSLAMPALASAGVEARVSPAAPGGGAARQPKPAAKKAARLSDASAGSDGSGGDSGKHGLGGKAASMRPTNNQLTCVRARGCAANCACACAAS